MNIDQLNKTEETETSAAAFSEKQGKRDYKSTYELAFSGEITNYTYPQTTSYIADSGALKHMAFRKELFSELTEILNKNL